MTNSKELSVLLEAVEAGAKAIHGGHGCTCRAGAKGDAQAVLEAVVAAGWTIMRFPDMPDEAPDPGGSGPMGF